MKQILQMMIQNDDSNIGLAAFSGSNCIIGHLRLRCQELSFIIYLYAVATEIRLKINNIQWCQLVVDVIYIPVNY